MSFNLIAIGTEINEGVFSYTKGEASSGSGFKAVIFEVVAQLEKRITTKRKVILERVFKMIFNLI
jgi:hypothetical protein